MTVPNALGAKMTALTPRLHELVRRVEPIIKSHCDNKRWLFTGRLKDIRSIAEKIETGRFGSWAEITDIYACSIVVPARSVEAEAIQFCADTFQIDLKLRAEVGKSPDIFRFDSTRIVARLRPTSDIVADLESSVFALPFEIQIRTILDHAWCVSMHERTYKAPAIDWRLLRLQAQIKAAVEQLDMLIDAFDRTAETVERAPWSSVDDAQTISTAFKEYFGAGLIPEEARPKDFSRFSENVRRLVSASRKQCSVADALAGIRLELIEKAFGPFPLSISLFQYVSAVLIMKGLVTVPLKGFVLHITDELTSLFPNIKSKTRSFVYDMGRGVR